MASRILPNDSGVYQLLNTVTGKSYVGSSSRLRKRRAEHLKAIANGTHHSQKMRASAAKHGPEVFTFSILEHCPAQDLISRERYWMEAFNAVEAGYNVRPDPASNRGVKPTAEMRRKMSDAAKGKFVPKHVRDAMAASAAGRDMSKPVAASAEARRGKQLPKATREKISAANVGRPKTPEHVAKVSAALRGRDVPDGVRSKISEALKGRQLPPDVVAKRIGVKANPLGVAKRVEKLRGRPQSEEHVARRVAARARTNPSSSGVVGVSWDKRRNKWRARATVDGRAVELGFFDTVEAATEARRTIKPSTYVYV